MKFQFVGITKMIEENASKTKLLRNAMFYYYSSIIKNEVMLASVEKNHKVLCIGGGYMPCTAILFQKLTGAKVTIIDNDKSTLVSAKRLIKAVNLEDKVELKYCDGKDIDPSQFDVVHIAMQVSPKTQVFDHIYKGMKEGGKILIRKPKKHLEGGYHTNECGIKEIACVKQNALSNIERTLLYVK